MLERVYFDTCAFIELFQQTNRDRFDACEDLRVRAAKEEIIIVTSAISIAEVNKFDSPLLPADQSKKILEFFENPYIAVRACVRQTSELAHELTIKNGLMPVDAIHVATALLAEVTVLYTYDAAKGRRKGLLTHNGKIGTPPLRIESPPDPHRGTLLDPAVTSKYSSLTNTPKSPPQS